jgi:hypothetical protein
VGAFWAGVGLVGSQGADGALSARGEPCRQHGGNAAFSLFATPLVKLANPSAKRAVIQQQTVGFASTIKDK